MSYEAALVIIINVFAIFKNIICILLFNELSIQIVCKSYQNSKNFEASEIEAFVYFQKFCQFMKSHQYIRILGYELSIAIFRKLELQF